MLLFSTVAYPYTVLSWWRPFPVPTTSEKCLWYVSLLWHKSSTFIRQRSKMKREVLLLAEHKDGKSSSHPSILYDVSPDSGRRQTEAGGSTFKNNSSFTLTKDFQQRWYGAVRHHTSGLLYVQYWQKQDSDTRVGEGTRTFWWNLTYLQLLDFHNSKLDHQLFNASILMTEDSKLDHQLFNASILMIAVTSSML